MIVNLAEGSGNETTHSAVQWQCASSQPWSTTIEVTWKLDASEILQGGSGCYSRPRTKFMIVQELLRYCWKSREWTILHSQLHKTGIYIPCRSMSSQIWNGICWWIIAFRVYAKCRWKEQLMNLSPPGLSCTQVRRAIIVSPDQLTRLLQGKSRCVLNGLSYTEIQSYNLTLRRYSDVSVLNLRWHLSI